MSRKIVNAMLCSLALLLSFFFYESFVNSQTQNKDLYEYQTIYMNKGISNNCDIDRIVGESYCITNTGERVVVYRYFLIQNEGGNNAN